MTDINELMERDPLDLTDTDLMKIIEYERSQRKNFNLTGKAKTTKPKASTKTKKQPDLPELDVKVDLSDI